MLELFKTRQNNELIRARLKGEPTRNEMLLWYASCTFVKKSDQSDSRYKISVKEFQKLIGVESDNFTDFKDTIRSIQSKGIEVEDDQVWAYYNYFASPKYLKGEGVFEFGFLPEIHEKLKRKDGKDSQFTVIEINEIVNLKTKYGAKMFSELKSIKNQRQKTLKISVEEFKLRFGLNKKKSYSRFNNIRQKVLEPMKIDLDENATLSFKLEVHKSGNAVTDLSFHLIDNISNIQKKIVAKDKDISSEVSSLDYYKNAERLNHWGISQDKSKDLLDDLNDQEVSSIIDEVTNMIDQGEIKITQAAGTIINKLKSAKITSKIEYKKSENKDQIDKNKSFWEVNSDKYHDIMASTSYLQSNSGDIIKWNDDNFEDQLRPFLKNKD